MLCLSAYTIYNWPSLSRDHQTVTIMNQCCYGFDDQIYSIVFKYFGSITEPEGSISPPSFDGQLLDL